MTNRGMEIPMDKVSRVVASARVFGTNSYFKLF